MIRANLRLLVSLAVILVAETAGLGAERRYPIQPPDTSSPQATLNSFMDSCNEAYRIIRARGRGERGERGSNAYHPVVRRIFGCLDLSEQPAYMREHVAAESAVCLKEVLDRIDERDLQPPEEIPGAQATEDAEEPGGPARWRIPHTPITIARVREGPREGEYLFSPDTVEQATEFYEEMKKLPYRKQKEGPPVSKGFYKWFLSEPGSPALAAVVRRLPHWVENRAFGQALWQWTGLLLVILVGAIAMFTAYRIGRSRAARMREKGFLRYGVTLLFPIAAMLVPLIVRDLITEQLRISGETLMVVSFSANLAFLFAVLVVIVAVGSRIAETIIASPRIQPKGLDAQLIRITCRVLGLGAATVVFLEGGKYLGIPLTTLLAGAGVGGLAVALAAQDTLKGLFGSMMILLDKPYRVGERIIARGYDGVVEDIGLRSTKIRLLTGNMASIPNEEMARSDVENVGRRPHIRRIADLHVPLDTPRDRLHRALDVVRKALEGHEGMDPEFPPRVYFNEFNPDSFNIRVIYWYNPPKYWDFLAFSEKLNLEIVRAFDEHGIKFSLPVRMTYTQSDGEPQPLELKLAGGGELPGKPSRD